MDAGTDHYHFLGLPSGEEGIKLSEKEITKAYRLKALELHPDKRPDDPNALADFQMLQKSYEILKDEKARKVFDDLIRAKQEKLKRETQQGSKRKRMMSDLEERERRSLANISNVKAKSEDEIIAKKTKQDINIMREMHAASFRATRVPAVKKESSTSTGGGSSSSEKEKMIKVSWGKGVFEYTAEILRDLFETIGEVKEVIRSRKKRRCALIVMDTKEAAVVACETVCGDVSNPLVVRLVQAAAHEPVSPQLNDHLVGQAFEDSVLEKLRKLVKNKIQLQKHHADRRPDPSLCTIRNRNRWQTYLSHKVKNNFWKMDTWTCSREGKTEKNRETSCMIIRSLKFFSSLKINNIIIFHVIYYYIKTACWHQMLERIFCEGIDLELYRDPRILEQVVNCKAQYYLMDCIIPDEYHLQTLETSTASDN